MKVESNVLIENSTQIFPDPKNFENFHENYWNKTNSLADAGNTIILRTSRNIGEISEWKYEFDIECKRNKNYNFQRFIWDRILTRQEKRNGSKFPDIRRCYWSPFNVFPSFWKNGDLFDPFHEICYWWQSSENKAVALLLLCFSPVVKWGLIF